MKWSTNATRSALSGVTGDPTIYTVHQLTVTMEDNLFAGFTEFWRLMLTESPKSWTSRWEILLIEFWTDAGLFNTIFTTPTRDYDEPTIWKLASDKVLREYEKLPSVHEDMTEFAQCHRRLEQRYWALVKETAKVDMIAKLMLGIRQTRPMPIWGTYCHYVDHMFDLGI
jgi:hypothetical protein